ncbi:MAG: pentapeptide repeat-containing protein [Cyanobacteria bacterium J06600_6]
MSKFIATGLFSSRGEAVEKAVWHGVKKGFEPRECLAYWRYPIFTEGKFRKEPDILIADYDLGLIVVEVKAIRSEQLVAIQGHRWQYRNFYTDSGNPYQQAERQLFALLAYCDREPLLRQQIQARAIVALPYVSQNEWQARGFANLPSSPPILFQEDLTNSDFLVRTIAKSKPLTTGVELTPTQWELLLAVLGGTALYTPEYKQIKSAGAGKGKLIQQVRSRLNQLDLRQEAIAKQIPPGMQRIRGIAGSGKTVALCQKAALMSLKYPQWQIALVFFSRSLYQPLTQQVDRWMRYFTQDRTGYDPDNSGLKILHAWGSKQQSGFYGTVCKASGSIPLSVAFTLSNPPHEALAEACLQLLENRLVPQIFDAVLIDEAQDLVSDRWHYQHKQPFFWLAYQSLCPVNPVSPQQRRLIWAYDELQSLGSLTIPEPVELFGEELGHLVTGQYEQEIDKTEIIACSYRTPQQIVMVAQAIALGLLRTKGLIAGSNYPEEWAALGWQISGDWQLGNKMTLTRINSPNIIGELWSGDTIDFAQFPSRQQELTSLAQKIEHNLTADELTADSILIVVLGSTYEATSLLKQTAIFLINQGLNIYLPGQHTYNEIDPQTQNNPDQFWHAGAITVSTIHRAKGQEADQVYLVGLDRIAQADNICLRHQLFTALTRTRAWVGVSGIGNYPLYDELKQLINQSASNHNRLSFTVTNLPQRELRISDRATLVQGYALGRRNFRHANLRHTDLAQMHLANINLIDADLSHANLTGVNLTNAKLIAANLSHADLSHANLTNAKLMGADLTDAILTDANFERAQT